MIITALHYLCFLLSLGFDWRNKSNSHFQTTWNSSKISTLLYIISSTPFLVLGNALKHCLEPVLSVWYNTVLTQSNLQWANQEQCLLSPQLISYDTKSVTWYGYVIIVNLGIVYTPYCAIFGALQWPTRLVFWLDYVSPKYQPWVEQTCLISICLYIKSHNPHLTV